MGIDQARHQPVAGGVDDLPCPAPQILPLLLGPSHGGNVLALDQHAARSRVGAVADGSVVDESSASRAGPNRRALFDEGAHALVAIARVEALDQRRKTERLRLGCA